MLTGWVGRETEGQMNKGHLRDILLVLEVPGDIPVLSQGQQLW